MLVDEKVDEQILNKLRYLRDYFIKFYTIVYPVYIQYLHHFIHPIEIMVWPTPFDKKLDEYDAMELPGQQLLSAQADSPLDHVLNLDLKASPACQRITSIMVNMGSSTNDLEIMEKLMASGMNVAIVNTMFGCKDDHIETIKMLRQATKNYSVTVGRNYPLAIALSLPGRKIRTGKIADSFGHEVELKTGDLLRLTTDESYRERCSTYTVYVDYLYFADRLHKNDIVLLDNELIMLKVDIISTTTLTCKIERGGMLGSFKDVFVPNVHIEMPNYCERDKIAVDMGVHHQVDFLIAPFVNSADAILELKSMLGEKGRKIAIIANIQTNEGYENFDEIIQLANAVMISRQELGSDITPQKLVIAQKNLIARANKANIPVSVSAQLLSSMRYKILPHRAELLDISNCVIDGVDGLVTAAETAVGQYPVEAVLVLAAACKEAEACVWTKQIFQDHVDKTEIPCTQAEGAAISAVMAAQRCLASAIVVVTTTGQSALTISKYRPRCPVIAVTRYSIIARQMQLIRGVMPLVYEDPLDPDWQIDLDKRVKFCTQWALSNGFIRIGDPIIIVSGWRQGSGFTNTMRVAYMT